MEKRTYASALRAAACLVSLALVASAFVAQRHYERLDLGWWLLAGALLTAVLWQRGLRLEGSALEGPAGPSTPRRRLLGAVLALAGAGLWAQGSWSLSQNWARNFDRTWVFWFLGTILLGGGLDLLWARWRDPSRARSSRLTLLVLGLVAIGALFRLGTFYFFPSPYYVTQVEELQVGAMGADVLAGSRIRWEFLSQAWLGALGLLVGGPTLLATRLPSTLISIAKLVPIFLWLRFSVGNAGAVVGTFLLAVSSWDTTFARVQTNHDVFVVAAAFALLAGPARRGRPSAYVWLGLLSGYVMFEYVLYRPLALFALAGALVTSLRDRHARWPARLLRPLVAVALFAAMTAPLYLYLMQSGRMREFFDGYGRARANTVYYNDDDDWQTLVAKRMERVELGLGMFFFRGAGSPVANPKSVPLADPFTGAMLVLGAAYGFAHPLRHLFGLTLVACLATLASALVVTGNFDFVRAGSAVGYLFALTGFGAAAVTEALRPLGRIGGRGLALAILAGGSIYATWINLDYLHFFVTAPEIRRAQFRDLAYLSWWLGRNVRADERAIVAAPNFSYVMQLHDAYWMRGKDVHGASFWDVHSALRDWAQHPQDTVVLLYAGPTSKDLKGYLDRILPDAPFSLEPGPIGPDKDLLYLRRRGTPPDLETPLRRWSCEPVTITVDLLGESGELLAAVQGTAGMIDPVLWPEPIQEAVRRSRPRLKRAVARFRAAFRVEKAGDYVFPVEIYPGVGTLLIDGAEVRYPPTTGVRLESGLHHLELRSEYDPNAAAPMHRLFWLGPDSGGRRELLPFHRISPPRAGCEGGPGAPRSVDAAAGEVEDPDVRLAQ